MTVWALPVQTAVEEEEEAEAEAEAVVKAAHIP